MMSDSFQDFLGSFTFESPDFKRALKILIKYEIHVLLQRLSDTGEESVVITASIADRTNGHLGSQKGRSFLRDAQIKALEEQFLHYCTGLEQPYRERRQELYPREDSPPVFVKQEPRSGFVGYRQGDVTRKERLLSDQDSVHEADRRQFYQNSRTESSISVDQSENSWIERMIPVDDSSSRVPFYQDSPEFFKDCYSERGLVGRCNDVCCRGTSLDFVGTSTRASIPSMDRSVINLTNNQDNARTHKDAVSYSKEKDYYGFVDMTLDRPETGERLVGSSSKLADALSSAETVLSDQMFEGTQSKDLRGVKSRDQLSEAVSGDKRSRENLFQANNVNDARNGNSRSKIAEILSSDKPVLQEQTIMEANTNTIAAERNGLNGKFSDCLEKASAFVPIENNHRNSVEFASKGSIGEDFSVKRDYDITVGNQKGGEEENIHGILTRKDGNSEGPKRKLCSRVPDYKLKSLLQTGADDLGKTDTFKGKVLVKKEPLFEGSEIESDGSVIMNEEVLVRQNSEKQEGSPQGNKNALKLNIKEESGQEGMSGYIKSEAESETGEETPGSCKELGRSLRFVCHYCGQMFKNKQYREFHEKLHLAKFPYVCQSCGEGFNEEQSYEEHGKVHITNPLLNCESCGYRTTRKFRMNSHREICRKPSKVFLCPYCQKPFLAKRYMKVHMKSHDLSNVHHCPYCVNTYPLKNSLLKHIRTKHKIY